MYYPSSKNKGTDQLRGYREADLHLCFRLCRLLVFRGGSNVSFTINDNHTDFHSITSLPMMLFFNIIIQDIFQSVMSKYIGNSFGLVSFNFSLSSNSARSNFAENETI